MFFRSVVLFAVMAFTARASGCPGDFDNNRQVDFADFLALAGAYGSQQGEAGYNAVMDMDTNGSIDMADFLAFANLFGQLCVAELTRLTNNETIELHPAWSPPDGRKIAFLSGFEDPELWVMNADGGDSLRLATSIAVDTESYTTLAWSPNGEQIAFSSARDGNAEIYKAAANGEGLTRLTNNNAEDLYPSWSPDGARIAFSSNQDGNFEIYVTGPEGSDLTRLTNSSVQDLLPVWSPDSKKIAYTSIGVDSNQNEFAVISVVDVVSATVTQLTADSEGSLLPAWSTDGTRITFWSSRDNARTNYGDMYVMNADGSEVTRLTNQDIWDDLWVDAAWSPDGSRVVYSAVGDGPLYVMNANGTDVRRLTNRENAEYFPAWSPDGRKVAFLSRPETTFDIYVVEIPPE
ncbi:MAG: hypothetical protein OYM47_18510 [Gemmatimonadota bacterium]|nr:hypothetical protein [Gemmatimonadota bacterium]